MMIFIQVPEIVAGLKTETRRIVKPDETWFFDDGDNSQFVLGRNDRLKWWTGRDYAVVPKRGQPGWTMPDGKRLRIEMLSIFKKPLHAITEEGARAEGVPHIAEYKRLWQSINKTEGTRWEDNPEVWVIKFKAIFV